MAVNAESLVARVGGLAVVCIPKNGGSSIKRALLAAQGIEARDAELHRHPALNLGADVKGCFVAAFLRHPAARLVSIWQDKILRDRGRPTRHLLSLGFELGMPFTAFARHAVTVKDSDIHLVPQCEFLPERVDFTGLVETLNDDWRELQTRFAWLPDIGHEHKTTGGDWRPHCDGEALFMIEAHYNEDLQLYEQGADLRAQRDASNRLG